MSPTQESESQPRTPEHIAIIMDGNGRWAKSRGLPRIRGHEEGAKSVENCLEACSEAGVRYLTLYAFSAENWRRPNNEVRALMGLLEQFLRSHKNDLVKRGIRLHAIGRIDRLPGGCRRVLEDCMKATRDLDSFHLVLALSYGGRQEIADAMRSIATRVAEGTVTPEQVDEALIADHLYTRNTPDPDLLIRTSGELRVSNFLLWQLSYTEIYISDKLWPDFGRDDLMEAIREYGRRQRRFGDIG